MINNNYVPEWHIKYTLARNQDHMDLLFDCMGDAGKFMSCGYNAQVDYYDEDKYCIVQLGDCNGLSITEVHALLLHEAVHIWQTLKELMNEKEPSREFEAYSIQRIALDLFVMYRESKSD